MRGTVALVALAACGGGSDATPDAPPIIDVPLTDAPSSMPQTLAETGLCLDAGCAQIAPGILPYTPRFQLYSDGATKKRWIYLPPGTQIDTSDMDFWQFPVGTKLWKEFTRDDTRVETRLVWRIGDGDSNQDWYYGAFVWNATQDATHLAEFGEDNANGTDHDVPSKVLCRQCHDNLRPSRVLGFSALQLDFDGAPGELDLEDLIDGGLVTQPPSGAGSYFPFDAASSATTTEALGYMHANCGHCHNPTSNIQGNTPLQLRLTVDTVGDIASTPTYQTAVGVTAAIPIDGHTLIVDPGSTSTSILIDRFETATNQRMPAIGTELMDMDADTTLTSWISAMQ
jgi:hypothetical protein